MENKTAHQQLNKFVGLWNTTGRILPTTTSPEISVSGTDSYEWLPGGYFLLHKVDVQMGDERNETLEIIGWNHLHKHYVLQYYESKGNSGSMAGTVANGQWTFLGETLRFKGGFNAD